MHGWQRMCGTLRKPAWRPEAPDGDRIPVWSGRHERVIISRVVSPKREGDYANISPKSKAVNRGSDCVIPPPAPSHTTLSLNGDAARSTVSWRVAGMVWTWEKLMSLDQRRKRTHMHTPKVRNLVGKWKFDLCRNSNEEAGVSYWAYVTLSTGSWHTVMLLLETSK